MRQLQSMDACRFVRLVEGRSGVLSEGFKSLVLSFEEQPRLEGSARLGASRWIAGAVFHTLGARVALPRAEVPNVSSSGLSEQWYDSQRAKQRCQRSGSGKKETSS